MGAGSRSVRALAHEVWVRDQLDPDEEKVKEAGALGWTVVVARVITFAGGTKREEKRRVVYNPRVRRVEVHPCRVPEGEEGYTGADCPDPEEDLEETGEPVPEEGDAQTSPPPDRAHTEP